MPNDNASFLSANGKRRILIVDDEAINREILATMLDDKYELLYAEDGEHAMQQVWAHRETISLVLLDLIMPNMSGQEVLQLMKAAPELRDIPVIVVTADFSQEIVCLDAGASDFIQKPYPNPGVVQARVRRTIELSEDRQIIQSAERDPLTDLYNLEFLYSYGEQYDQHHKGISTDAIVIDINHFAMVNERFGRAYADDVLRKVGMCVQTFVHDDGGIVSRSGDVFQVYCPHREDYKAMLDGITTSLVDEHNANRPIRLRMGVYSNVDKSLRIERRFDRAKMAADTVRDSYTRSIGVYDDALLKSELYSQRLMDDFAQAIEDRQFVVHYQPKFDIQSSKPMLSSSEALIRWKHPELGMISPGVFIPLFEDNGLIQTLDHYVWEEAARQIREWKDTVGWSVPVSVNVSRVDLYDTGMVDMLQGILERYDLNPGDLHLEITESAYAEDSKQIIEMVKRLRSMGFHIEMDDFGTGYSSLNMLATLPIDALKLDMRFVRTAFAQEGDNDTHMIKVVIDIAFHLSVPVIAEGVETEEQLNALRDLGCDTVQGYYFSEPVRAEKFERFLEEGKVAEQEAQEAAKAAEQKIGTRPEVQDEEGEKRSWWERIPAVSLSTSRIWFTVAAILVAVALLVSEFMLFRGYARDVEANNRYMAAQLATTDLEIGSDHLTESVRYFVSTGDTAYMDDYFEELEVTRRRDIAVETVRNMLANVDNGREAYESLNTALENSNELVGLEYRAMKLMLEAGGYNESLMPQQLREFELSAEDEGLPNSEKVQKARDLVFGSDYAGYKERIKSNSQRCSQILIQTFEQLHLRAEEAMRGLLNLQVFLTILLLLVVVGIVVFIYGMVQAPLKRMVDMMRKKQVVTPVGATELRFVAETYNGIFEDNRKKFERLNYGSMHDELTGLFNRKAFDIMKRDMDMSDTALLLVDVDKFKLVNDTYGHDVGDLVLKRVAEVLGYSFRSSDLVFRLGGDEFVVIMSNVNSSARELVHRKIEQANQMLQQPSDDLPPASLSVGVAFADRENPEGDIFKDADTALYRMKQAGRCGCVIY